MPTGPDTTIADKAAAVRAALRSLVGRDGFHGASMSKVAKEAGVATGTAYVYYESKDELVLAAYLETKADLGAAATAGVDDAAPAHDRFIAMWRNIHRHLRDDPDRARFLLQVDASPYAAAAHAAAMANVDDPLVAQASTPDFAAELAALPEQVLYELSIAPAVWLAAHEADLGDDELALVATACWRAVTTRR